MIVTLTANPSLDRAIALDTALRPGEVQSARSARDDAGGKGINVARVVSAAGLDALAVLPLAAGDPYDVALRADGLPAWRIPVRRWARANMTIVDPAGVTTKLNFPGAPLDSSDGAAVVEAIVTASRNARWLVLAGSLPPGVGDDFYAEVIRAVRHSHGGAAPRIAVDTSGAALRAVVEHSHPDIVKPNAEELGDLVGETLSDDDLDRVRTAASALVPSRVGAALVTLGARGALLMTADGAWVAETPRVGVASTVGAGDSALAGYLIADSEGAPPEARLRRAVRYGAAAASLPGTQAPRPEDLPAGDVVVRELT
jgi:1-phosphofructokinase